MQQRELKKRFFSIPQVLGSLVFVTALVWVVLPQTSTQRPAVHEATETFSHLRRDIYEYYRQFGTLPYSTSDLRASGVIESPYDSSYYAMDDYGWRELRVVDGRLEGVLYVRGWGDESPSVQQELPSERVVAEGPKWKWWRHHDHY